MDRWAFSRMAGPLAGLVLAVSVLVGCSGSTGPDKTLDAFLRGWRDGKLDEVGFLNPDGSGISATEVSAQLRSLSGELAGTPPALSGSGEPTVSKNAATARITLDWTLAGGVHWTYPTTVQLSKAKDDWQVIWAPAVVHQQLTSGDQLAVRRLPGRRAPVLDAAGSPVVTLRPVVRVGVERQRVVDLAKLVNELDAALKSIRSDIGDINLSGLPARVQAATPGAFNEVVMLREEVYNKIKARIQPLDGTVFYREQRQLAPTRTFARALLGTIDDVTKEDLDAHPDAFVIGDQAGHGGLQGRYDERLRGAPGQAVVIARKAPDGTVSDTEVFRSDAKPGTPIRITLDQRVQQAAEDALSGQARNSALVAVRVGDGAVLAAANGPDGGTNNLAFTAQVPPGSTFKVVTALGLLDAGQVSLDQKVNCPKTFPVPGRPPVKNADNFELGNVPFRMDFAKSCNTAFASLAPRLGPDRLAATGTEVGLGAQWDLGIDAFSGQVSRGESPAEQAAAAFGQGTTLVSPLAMAGVAAAVAHGGWQQPTVLLDPAPAHPAPDGPALKPSSVDPLRQLMREVVTSPVGTATALKDIPGKPVYGKTGTAEFDNNPEHTHSWFTGYQGDLAFAVFVENGGSSATAAVPIAARFLRALTS